jgi:hypothetical protein
LLFDHYVLNSIRLKEFPVLAQKLGFEGLRDLLSAKLISIRCECLQITEVGRTGLFGDPILPLLTFKFNWIDMNDREKYTHDCLQTMHEVPGLRLKDTIKLKRAIAQAISPLSKEAKLELGTSFSNDFTNPKLIKAAADLVLHKRFGKEINTLYQLEIHPCDGDGVFRAETNLGKIASLSDLEVHQVLQAALLGIASTNQVIGEMKTYNALSGFREDELPLFRKKLDFLADRLSGERTEKRLGKIIELSGIPSFQGSEKVFNVEKLVKVRDSNETLEFKGWLQSGGSENEKEIKERVSGWRAQAGLKLSSLQGKAMRFFVTTTSGMIPYAHAPIISLGLGILDTFILEKVFPRSGVAAFVNELYPSIFENPKE